MASVDKLLPWVPTDAIVTAAQHTAQATDKALDAWTDAELRYARSCLSFLDMSYSTIPLSALKARLIQLDREGICF